VPTHTEIRNSLVAALVMSCAGCGGEPTARELGNARAFEALLTAVSLRNRSELERDAALIDARNASGELSESRNRDLQEIIDKARAGDWAAAERQAYAFRQQFGDDGSYFK
jgi:hypothetical protein